MSRLDNLNNLGLVYLPDTITIRLKNNRSSKSELYTLIHNRDHYNVASMFFEEQRLNETQNSVTLVSVIAAPYVNLFVDITSKDLQLFAAALEGALTKADI